MANRWRGGQCLLMSESNYPNASLLLLWDFLSQEASLFLALTVPKVLHLLLYYSSAFSQ